MKKTKKTYPILLIALIVILALFLPRFLIQRSHNRALARETSAVVTQAVKVLQLKADQKPIEIILPSYLEAINYTTIWARTNGYLSNFLVDIGDRVNEGQLLATIDTPDVDAEYIRAQGELAATIAKEEIAQITADRWTTLYDHNPEAISKEEVDVKVADQLTSAADMLAAEGNAEYWRSLQDFQNVYAPFKGIITQRNVIDLGTLITAGSADNPIHLFQIARTDTLRAFVDVPQSLFYLIKDGLPATVTVWQYPGKSFPGIIDRNSGALDPQARTLLTQVNIDNRAGNLMPGLYAEVKFSFIPIQKAFSIPVSALIIRSGPPFVALVKDNKVHLQTVKIGIDDGRTIQILDGLHDGDFLIISPTDRTLEGITVQPVLLTKEDQKMLLGTS